jgi:hypothetical protein
MVVVSRRTGLVLKSEKKLMTYVLLFGKPHGPSHFQLHSSIMIVISLWSILTLLEPVSH